MGMEDAKRRKAGKMTKPEAANLLNALQEEEGRLEFIPAQGSSKEQRPGDDW